MYDLPLQWLNIKWAKKIWIPIIPCNLVPVLATRCLYWGVCLSSGQLDLTQLCSWPWDTSMGGHLSWVCLTAKVKLTWCSTALSHWMPLLGGTSDLSAKRSSENSNTICISCFALQRSFLQKTNNSLHPIITSVQLETQIILHITLHHNCCALFIVIKVYILQVTIIIEAPA